MPDITPLRPEDPARLGPYTLIGRLGRGGFGVVYLADSPNAGRVAVKLLQTELAAASGERDRFAREATAAKQVARFCTAQVLDADFAGDRPYIVSEYVPGPSLHSLVRERGPLAGGALDRLAIGTATALVAIHQAGVVHRDLKPPNVLMGPDGPRVIDFGIARMMDRAATLTAHTVGTPAYMAPEQVLGREITPAVDVFAWGATMVFAAGGAPPFGRDTLAVLAHRILNEEPALGPLSGRLRALVADCLAKDPARRPAAGLLLMRLLGHDTVPRGPQTTILAEGVTAAAPRTPSPGTPTPGTPMPGTPIPGTHVPGTPRSGGSLSGTPVLGTPVPGSPVSGVPMPGISVPGTPRSDPPTLVAGADITTSATVVAPPEKKRRRWALAAAAVFVAVAMAGAATVAPAALHGSRDTPPKPGPTVTVHTTETTRVGGRPPVSQGTSSSSSPTHEEPHPVLVVLPSGCDLGATGTTCAITLRAVGGSLSWTASAGDPLAVYPPSGSLGPGETATITVTLHPPSPRVAGSGSVTITSAAGTRTVAVSWQGAPDPAPSAS